MTSETTGYALQSQTAKTPSDTQWQAFPQTRYLGSKRKLLGFLEPILSELPFSTALDPFCGTGAAAYLLKTKGAAVTASDTMAFNVATARALVVNDETTLGDEGKQLATDLPGTGPAPGFVERTFEGLFFKSEENRFIDQMLERMRCLDGFKKDLALFALGQACLAKRPYNLFHRANLNMRERKVNRTFGNKTTWDRPFEMLFDRYLQEAEAALFSSGRPCQAIQADVLKVDPEGYDLVYLDPPYLSRKGAGVDYLDYYHFLEGLTAPETWPERILHKYKHKPLVGRGRSPWCDPRRISSVFEQTIRRFRPATLVISYRSDGIPSIDEISGWLTKAGKQTTIHDAGTYTYALSRNRASHEVVMVGK